MSLIKWKPLNNEIDTFDNIIKTWNNDIEDGTETIFVAEKEEPLIITVSFDVIN